ncbi:hypothetical protein GMDG_07532 [Pseudogymnoascus destructans 20631-21]|uniref:Uncharacterized protein n=2 Tax=Pseudogymnoascus destructans TaxID=655981 RepID=L8FYS4_PSED2|nr:hypothetical protein GMDG_07532 [Pseudogymnoascus destructans 20631-21]
MGLMLYAAVVFLFAMLLLHQVYASPSTPFVESIHNDSIFVILSPVKLRPIISYVLEYFLLLLSRATSIKIPSASELVGSCLSILTRESLDKLVSTAHWATDKLFTCEISYMITIAITSFFTEFFQITYLRIFISTGALVVTNTSNLDFPKERDSLYEATHQFNYKICALGSVIFTAIDYTSFVLDAIFTLRRVVHQCWGPGEIYCCGTRSVVNCIASAVAMVIIGSSAVGLFIRGAVENVLESWKFLEAARDEEAARFRFDPDTMEKAANAMKQRGRFTEDDREEQMKEEALREIIRLYEADEIQDSQVSAVEAAAQTDSVHIQTHQKL